MSGASRRGGPKDHGNNNNNTSDGDGGKRDDMPRNRSQNDISDSSGGERGGGNNGGGKGMRRKKNKGNKRDGNNSNNNTNDRRKDEVIFDSSTFPALMGSTKTTSSTDKPIASVGFSGYADALLQKNKPPNAVNINGGSNLEQAGQASSNKDETSQIAMKVGEMKVNAIDDTNEKEPSTIAVGALTGSPVKETPVIEPAAPESTFENKPTDAGNGPLETSSPTPGGPQDELEQLNTSDKGLNPVPQQSVTTELIETMTKSSEESESQLVTEPSLTPAPAPPPAWGNKRSFIDVVKKHP